MVVNQKKSNTDDFKLDNQKFLIQATIATLMINLFHKIVREIPGSFTLPGILAVVGLVSMLIIVGFLSLSIILLILKRKLGSYVAIIPGIWAILQCLVMHVILGYPDLNGVWWYPMFPFLQGVLIIYFSSRLWHRDYIFKDV